MILTKEYLISKGFHEDEYIGCLTYTFHEGMVNGEYLSMSIRVYNHKGSFIVEAFNGNEMVRINTNSVERVNQTLSFLKIRERI